MSQEYIGALVIVIGAGLKIFNIEIENSAIEGLIAGIIAIWIAVRRFRKGDISVLGAKK